MASTPRVVEGTPRALPMMLKAALPVVPGLNLLPGIRKHGTELPDLALVRHDVPVDTKHVAAYADVCGFPHKDTLPLTYPHLLAFPLHLAIMTSGSFPFPAIGTVHLENTITAHRALSPTETLQVTARAENLRPHAKGQVFDMCTTVHSAGELVWEEVSTFLRRGKVDPSLPATSSSTTPLPEAAPNGTVWTVGGDLGRQYAAVSGDHNPIHLHPITARVLGFPRQIAHGMWSKARALAALENRLPDAVRVDVAFRKPVLLPGTVAFDSRPTEDGYAFSLTRPETGSAHLLGQASRI